MRLLYLLIPHFLQVVNGALPKELVILARGLVYPKPQFERVEMLRDICEEKRDAFFRPFRSNLTKKEIKEELAAWATEMEGNGHNGTDDSVRVLIQHWGQWREQAEQRVFALLTEAKTVYKEIVSSSSHCAVNISLCQERFDLLPPRVHQVFALLTAGGLQLSRSPPSPRPSSNHSFTLLPSFNFTLPPLNWTSPEGNGTNPQWNGTMPVNGSLSFDDSEETDLIDDIRREEEREGFSFGNLGVYTEWFNYWMQGTMNPSNWNATRDSILAWKNGNSSALPRFPTSLIASVVLPEERDWTLGVLDALERGIEGARREGMDVDASLEVSTAVADLSRLFSSVADSFKGNLVEGYVHPPLIPSRQRDEGQGASMEVSPVDWSSIQSRLVEMPVESAVKESNTLREEAQLMYRAIDSMGITDEIMGYLGQSLSPLQITPPFPYSLYATAKNNWNDLSREKRSLLSADVSGSRIDLIFGHNQNVETSPPSPPSAPSISSILTGLGSKIGEKMDELEKLGTGFISQVVNAITNQTVPNITSIAQLPSNLFANSSILPNHPSLMGNVSDFLSNATYAMNNITSMAQNHSMPSSLPDFSTALASLLGGSMITSDAASTASPMLQPAGPKDLSLVNIISGILDNMDQVTVPPGKETTSTPEPSEMPTDGSSNEDSSEAGIPSERPTSMKVPSTAGTDPQSSIAPVVSSTSPHPSSSITASLPPILTSSTVPSALSYPPSTNHPTVQSSPIPISQSPTPVSPFPSPPITSTQRSILPSIPTDLKDILSGHGFQIPDIKNLSSVVASIDRLNEFLANRTRIMIETMTRTIEEAFKMGQNNREKMTAAVDATIAEAKEVVNNLTEAFGVRPAPSPVSWTDIKNNLWMTPNVSRDDYEYVEYDYEEMEMGMPAAGNVSGGIEGGMGNGTIILPPTNLTMIAEEDERVIRSTLLFYDKVNCTVSALFSIVANESLSIPETKRALNAVYWNATLIQRQMISFMVRNADIPSIDFEEGVKLRGPCSNGTERLARPMDETSKLLMN